MKHNLRNDGMARLIPAALAVLFAACGGGKPPTAEDVKRAIAFKYDTGQGGDPFRLSNACYERLGECGTESDGRWAPSLDTVDVKEIGERHSARRPIRVGGGDLWHTQKWWPAKAELSVTCRCGAKTAVIRVPESSDVTDYEKSGGWRATNAL